jgi:hypothetical protein
MLRRRPVKLVPVTTKASYANFPPAAGGENDWRYGESPYSTRSEWSLR